MNDLENDLFFLNEINKKINSNSFFKKENLIQYMIFQFIGIFFIY